MRAPGFRTPVNTARGLWSTNGQFTVCGGDKGTIFSFLAETGALEAEIGGGGGGGGGGGDEPHAGKAIYALDICGHLMASADEAGTVVVWADG